jgi:signal transduction histidine kinase
MLADWCLVELAGTGDATLLGNDLGPRAGAMTVAHAEAIDSPSARRQQVTLGGSTVRPRVATRVLETAAEAFYGCGLAVPCADGDEDPTLVGAMEIGSAIGLPLVARKRLLGVITLIRSGRARQYSVLDLALARHFAGCAALAISNAMLHEGVLADVRGRDEFLGAFIHDLKNPLACVKAYVQLLRRQAAPSGLILDVAQMALRLERLGGVTDRLNRAIEDAHGATSLDTPGFLDHHPRATDLVALVRDMIADYRLAQEHIRFDLEVSVPGLTGDWETVDLERVVGNLLDNAVKYGRDRVDVSLGVEITGSTAWAVLSVRDEGMGIPAQDLARVFDPYHRASNVTGRIGGWGIGLAAAKRIVAEHGGTIEAESEEGKGSTFTVRLPLPARDGVLTPARIELLSPTPTSLVAA